MKAIAHLPVAHAACTATCQMACHCILQAVCIIILDIVDIYFNVLSVELDDNFGTIGLTATNVSHLLALMGAPMHPHNITCSIRWYATIPRVSTELAVASFLIKLGIMLAV